jgi:hypothetical protein
MTNIIQRMKTTILDIIIVEAIHGLPFNDTRGMEDKNPTVTTINAFKPLPVTLGRIIQAVAKSKSMTTDEAMLYLSVERIEWEENQTGDATTSDQSEKTQQKLLELFKKQ